MSDACGTLVPFRDHTDSEEGGCQRCWLKDLPLCGSAPCSGGYLMDPSYEYWQPGMAKPKRKPRGCEFRFHCTLNWDKETAHPLRWSTSHLRRWPKKQPAPKKVKPTEARQLRVMAKLAKMSYMHKKELIINTKNLSAADIQLILTLGGK